MMRFAGLSNVASYCRTLQAQRTSNDRNKEYNNSKCVIFFFFTDSATSVIYTLSLHDALPIFLITLLNVTLIILTLSVSRLLNLLLRLVAFLLFLNPQCLASISRWITASSSWKRFCLFVCRALSSIMVICMLTAIRLLLTFVMSLYLLLRS